MVKLKELRGAAKAELEQCQSDSPIADIDYILGYMGFGKGDILLGERTLDPKEEKSFWQAIKRLKSGEPVQYIVGRCEFMSLEFEVSPATLIPRADTEILVEEVIELCKDIKNPTIFEVGTGSGCIAVSLAHYVKDARVISADVSAEAIAVARRNAQRHGSGVEFVEKDILTGFPDFDELPHIIVSNPPYIPSRDVLELEKKVREFEPNSALDGGEDGLDFYRFITDNAPLAPSGYIAFEVGIDQSRHVAALMENRFEDIRIINDLAGIERVVTGRIKGGF